MAKKKKAASTENTESTSTESTEATEAASVETTTEHKPFQASTRALPAVGTVIEKKRRDGSVCGTIKILEGGKILYPAEGENAKEFTSLSSAALANSKDMNLHTKAIDGWAWWGLKSRSKVGDGTPRAPRSANLQAKLDKLSVRREKLSEQVAAIDTEIESVTSQMALVQQAATASAGETASA